MAESDAGEFLLGRGQMGKALAEAVSRVVADRLEGQRGI
jgi:hypothetical protein